jgi:hypothetical protein
MTSTTIAIDSRRTAEPEVPMRLLVQENAVEKGAKAVRPMPLFIPLEQAYFWTAEWQAGEIEAMRDIAEGRVKHFASGSEAAAWLLADDDVA